jgi:cytochrome b pre-mRNA-processing protein 3
VLREIGVGDLSIPKKARALAGSGGALLHAYEEALAEGDQAIARTIAEALPLEEEARGAVAERLTHYLRDALARLQAQEFAALQTGEVSFPGPVLGSTGR